MMRTGRWLLALLAAGLVLGCLRSDSRAEAPAGGASPYGVVLVMGTPQLRDPTSSLRAMELAAQAGIVWLRLGFPWSWVEGTPGRFNWATHDALVAKARSLGLEVMGSLGYTAVWASSAPPEVTRAVDRERYPPRDYDAWGRYVFETVSRYRGQVRYWEVWNEPDLGGEGPFGFWRASEAEFARLLAVAYQNVKRADPRAQVVIGGLSLGGSPGVLNEDFFPRILRDPAYPAARYFDIAAFHQYGSRETARQRFLYVRGELEKVGAGDKPIWVTEVGATSESRPQDPPQYRGPEGQARYVRDMLPYLLQLGAQKVFWFSLTDAQLSGSNYISHGLLDSQLAPKPAYFAYRELTGAASGGGEQRGGGDLEGGGQGGGAGGVQPQPTPVVASAGPGITPPAAPVEVTPEPVADETVAVGESTAGGGEPIPSSATERSRGFPWPAAVAAAGAALVAGSGAAAWRRRRRSG